MKVLAPTSRVYKEATCESSTIKELLYAHETLIVAQRYDVRGIDLETHAIWQGYVEDPAAKDFVARKARTIALSKVQGTQQSTLFRSLKIPQGFHT
jgi:hypothetical protein